MGRRDWDEIHVNRALLEQVSEFKYLGYVLNESGTDDRKVASGRKVAGVLRSLVNGRGLQLSVQRCFISHCSCLFCCMAKTMIWRENDRSRIRAV